MRTIVAALVLVLAVSAAAQTPRPAPPAPAPAPVGADTWIIDVSTSGGLTGRGKGGVRAQWDGTLTCTPPLAPCGAALTTEAVNRLKALVATLTGDLPTANPRVLCSDCFITTMVVTRRTAAGIEVVVSYSWNDLEFASMPPAVKQLHEAVLGLVNGRVRARRRRAVRSRAAFRSPCRRKTAAPAS